MRKRKELDQYYTPEHLVTPLLDHVFPSIGGRILEPCCGDGSISRILEKLPRTAVLTNDIDPRNPADYHGDASALSFWEEATETQGFDWVITNPPFSHAFSILKHSLAHCENVAMLLRISFLEPTYERQDFLSEYPPDLVIFLPRFSFTRDGKSDMTTCAWMVWSKDLIDGGIRVAKKERPCRTK